MKKHMYQSNSIRKRPVIAVAIGAITSIVLTVASAAIFASLVTSGKLPPETIQKIVWPTQCIACAIGCFVSTVLAGNKIAILSAASAAVYLFILLAGNIVFMGGDMQGIGSGIISVLFGGTLPILTHLSARKGGKTPYKRKMRFVQNRQ